MKIVLIVDWHSEKMGYSDNCIPKFLADAGHEVHLITSNAQCYYDSPNYDEIFGKFNGPGLVECGVKRVHGYTLHRLPFSKVFGRIHFHGLYKILRELDPDIVQAGDTNSITSWEVSVFKPFFKYKLFVECHWHFSVFPIEYLKNTKGLKKFISKVYQHIYWNVFRHTIGALMSMASEKCFPIAQDSAVLAKKYFGFSRNKILIVNLGVDTLLFNPIRMPSQLESREGLRKKFGYSSNEIVCIYTGRLSLEKAPHILAQAVLKLRARGLPYRALFIGDGPKDYVDNLKKLDHSSVHDFVPYENLPAYYCMSDIGVWPKQESTSQLDAVACGLPIVLSDKTLTPERCEGNGILYEENNSDSLANSLEKLRDEKTRVLMGEHGANKIKNLYSWKTAVATYISEYHKAINGALE